MARDRQSERARAEVRARSLGFRSDGQLRYAQRQGWYPKFTEMKRDPDKKRQGVELSRWLRRSDMTQVADQWSQNHSRQARTKFSPRWSRARQANYTLAFYGAVPAGLDADLVKIRDGLIKQGYSDEQIEFLEAEYADAYSFLDDNLHGFYLADYMRKSGDWDIPSNWNPQRDPSPKIR